MESENAASVNIDQAVNKVSVKTPEFCEACPGAFFLIIEAQFNLYGIKQDQTKFYHALSSLPTSVIQRLSNSILNSNNYETLKTSIISSYKISKPEQFQQLLAAHTLSGKPSQILQRLQTLAESVDVSEDILKMQFFKALDTNVATALAAHESMTLDELGKLGDTISAFVPQKEATNFFSVNHAMTNTNKSRNEIQYSNTPSSPPADIPRTSNNKSYGTKPFTSNQRPKICRAHIYYANMARTCTNWCQWPDKDNVKFINRSHSRSSRRSQSPARSEQNF